MAVFNLPRFFTHLLMEIPILFRYMFMYFIFPITYFVSGIMINAIQCVFYFGLKPFSRRLYRQLNYYLSYSYYALMIFLIQWYSRSDVYVHVDKNEFKKYYGKEHAYVVMNHRYDIDWLVLGVVAERLSCSGNFKAYMKKIIQYIPAIGWCLYFSQNVFLERSFAKDKIIIHKQILECVDYPDTIWLLLNPEGTRFTHKKHAASIQVAKEKGLPHYKHHLTPRTKGFLVSLPPMRGKMDAIYDVTVSFNPNAQHVPTIANVLFGCKLEAHFYMRRIPFENVPESDEGAAAFLHDMFERKDKLQESFFKTGDYDASGLEKVDIIKIGQSYSVLLISTFWLGIVMGPVVYYLIKLLLYSNTLTLILVFGVFIGICLFFKNALNMTEAQNGSNYGIKEK